LFESNIFICFFLFDVDSWCTLLRHEKLSHVVVVIVEAVGATDVLTFSESFPFITSAFPMVVFPVFTHLMIYKDFVVVSHVFNFVIFHYCVSKFRINHYEFKLFIVLMLSLFLSIGINNCDVQFCILWCWVLCVIVFSVVCCGAVCCMLLC